MRYREAMIAWTPGTEEVRVGPLLRPGDANWTRHPINYLRTGGAAFLEPQEQTDAAVREMMLFIEFHTIVVRDRVPIDAVHREFLKIDEYRRRISPDIPGAEE